MKTAIAVLMLVAAAQAVNWANIKPMSKARPSILPLAPSSGRIIGGTEATVGQFPFQVGVFMDDSYFCGGSLISDSIVLTAAHCVDGFSKWEVHAGSLNIRDESEPGLAIVTTNDGTAHEAYGSFFIVNDIAIVRLGQSVSGPNIGSIRLPSRAGAGNSYVGTTARLSGWGKIRDSAPGITDVMQWVDLPVVDNQVCEDVYGANSVRTTTLCVDTSTGVSSCNGDSGGPLTTTEADGQLTEIGIVSYGASAGCEKGFPAAFTRVTEFLDWIATNSGIPVRP